jgi:hypothetical protein
MRTVGDVATYEAYKVAVLADDFAKAHAANPAATTRTFVRITLVDQLAGLAALISAMAADLGTVPGYSQHQPDPSTAAHPG